MPYTRLSTAIGGGRAAQVIGVEPNAAMRQQAQRKIADQPDAAQIGYRQGDADRTGLPDE